MENIVTVARRTLFLQVCTLLKNVAVSEHELLQTHGTSSYTDGIMYKINSHAEQKYLVLKVNSLITNHHTSRNGLTVCCVSIAITNSCLKSVKFL